MEDRLSRDVPVIREDVESIQVQTFDSRACNGVSGAQQAVKNGRRNVKKIPAMLLGNDKGMAKMNRIDIENAKNIVILEENFSRLFPANDLAENAVVHFGCGHKFGLERN